jgi:hypothetical protein
MNPRRRILWTVAALAPAVVAAALWARSYGRRDRLAWEADRPEARRVTCQLYSGRGRLCFASYSRPAERGHPQPTSFTSGDRASTGDMAEDVHVQLQQAGVIGNGTLGFAWSQHLASLTSGSHVWTGGVVPWWALTVLLATPAYATYRRLRPRPPQPEPQPAGPVAAAVPPRAAPFPELLPTGRPPPRRPTSYKSS